MTTGLHEEELIILAARPAVGKTAFALNIAQNIGTKLDKTVAIFSLEMGAESLVDRMLASEGVINSHSIRTGQLSDDCLPAVDHRNRTRKSSARGIRNFSSAEDFSKRVKSTSNRLESALSWSRATTR